MVTFSENKLLFLLFNFLQLFGQTSGFLQHRTGAKRVPGELTVAYSTISSRDYSKKTNSDRDEGLSRGNKKGPTIAIVGAGVGGLSVASRIASSPKAPPNTKVIILEKNTADMIGGRCGSFFREVQGIGKFRFERGPSLLLLKDVYLNLFKDCAADAEDDFDLRIEQCAPAYQVVFDDGDAIQLGFPKALNSNELDKLEHISRNKMNEYEQGGAAKWDEYMQCTAAFLDCGLPNFIQEKLDIKSFPSFIYQATRGGFKVK